MGNQVYTSAPWVIRCTPVHYRKSGVHQCTMGNQVYTSQLWEIRCKPMHYGKSGVHQCTMENQVYTSALWVIRCTPVHYGKLGVHQSRASERGLTNGYGHSSIYCIQQSTWKIKMRLVCILIIFFNITLYLDFCWSRGRIGPRMNLPCNIYICIHQNDKIPANTVFYPWRRDEV